MYNGFGVNYKKRLQEELAEEMTSYIDKKGLSHVLGLPLLGYAFADDNRFMDVFDAELTKHPKEIYRPGTTIIVSFLPYLPEYVKDNFTTDNKSVSEAWTYAYEHSIIVSAHINTFIIDFLDSLGREASLSNMHTDWNIDTHRPEWSHKIAAHIAGMGEFGPNGCIRTEYGPWGRFGSVMTEVKLEPSGQNSGTGINNEEGNVGKTEVGDKSNVADEYLGLSLMKNSVKVPKRIIETCPCDAIDESGIDKARCEQYCGTLNPHVPEPDACGKCYTR